MVYHDQVDIAVQAQRQEIRTASPAGNTVMSMGMDTITEPMPVAPPTIPPVNQPKATTAYIQNAIYNSQGHASEHSSRFHVVSNCICLRVELGSPVEREAKYFNGLTVKKSSIKHGFSQSQRRKYKSTVVAAFGTFLEYYDFSVYGYCAARMSAEFFPSDNLTISLLSMLAVFGPSFIARPSAGCSLGTSARYGCKISLWLPSSRIRLYRLVVSVSGADRKNPSLELAREMTQDLKWRCA